MWDCGPSGASSGQFSYDLGPHWQSILVATAAVWVSGDSDNVVRLDTPVGLSGPGDSKQGWAGHRRRQRDSDQGPGWCPSESGPDTGAAALSTGLGTPTAQLAPHVVQCQGPGRGCQVLALAAWLAHKLRASGVNCDIMMVKYCIELERVDHMVCRRRRFAAALLLIPRLFGKNPRSESHHKGATCRVQVRTGDQRHTRLPWQVTWMITMPVTWTAGHWPGHAWAQTSESWYVTFMRE